MYTKEYDPNNDVWRILDPEGDFIASVPFKSYAEGLLSHLNRG